jgi:hypothetical protein
MEPQRLCPRYRRREIQYGTQKGTGFGEKFRSRNRCGGAGAISGGTAVCDVRPRDKWKSAFVDGIGFCWTRRTHNSLVGIPAELVSKANRNHGGTNQTGDRPDADHGHEHDEFPTSRNPCTADGMPVQRMVEYAKVLASTRAAPSCWSTAGADYAATQVVNPMNASGKSLDDYWKLSLHPVVPGWWDSRLQQGRA